WFLTRGIRGIDGIVAAVAVQVEPALVADRVPADEAAGARVIIPGPEEHQAAVGIRLVAMPPCEPERRRCAARRGDDQPPVVIFPAVGDRLAAVRDPPCAAQLVGMAILTRASRRTAESAMAARPNRRDPGHRAIECERCSPPLCADNPSSNLSNYT